MFTFNRSSIKTIKFCGALLKNHIYGSLSLTTTMRRKKTSEVKPVKHLVWIDMEMTGLDVNNDHILEIACLITDSELNIVAEGPDIVIHQPDDILNNMNSWCIAQHGESGLTEASKKSIISLYDAESEILNFVKTHVPEKRCPLAGNSVWMDRLFLYKYMPRLNLYLHYRIIDISTIKELAKRWYPKEYSRIPQKSFQHRALQDIKESVMELKYYKANMFKLLE